MKATTRFLLALGSSAVLLHCGPSRERGGPAPIDPGALERPAFYDGDFVIEQRVTAEHPQGSESFRAVLEKHGDSLVLVALGPHGGRAFVLSQRGDEIAFESHIGRELPFPPRFMLLDVHRTWLAGLPGAPRPDGDHEAVIGQDRVREAWADGRLLSRSFERIDGQPPGVIRVTYEGGLSPDLNESPTRVVYENGWFGYRLLLEDLHRRPLPSPDGE